MKLKEHWNHVYETKTPEDVSWHQSQPDVSLHLIANSAVPLENGVIDVGGGTSALAQCLLKAGYSHVAVLDISAAALAQTKHHLGADADKIEWIEADITCFTPSRAYGIWHDRAVFHFLTEQADRAKYRQAMDNTLLPDAHVILATFAPDGPEKCSGLPVRRYDAASISLELGEEYELLEQLDETHVTPWQSEQKFCYFHFKKRNGMP